VSPHRIHPEFGGRPQVRERVFIAATRTEKNGSLLGEEPGLPDIEQFERGWNIQNWKLAKDLPLESKLTSVERKETLLTETEQSWIDAWDEFVLLFKEHNSGANLPGFPLWADDWIHIDDLKIPRGTPVWKKNFLEKNAEFYTSNKKFIDKWLSKHDSLKDFPPSRRKLEWQAQGANSLKETVMHFRPSGIRAKRATYLPAMVAITQTSILGKQGRRISVREGARLQGLPDWFDFLDQPQSVSFKQLGNGVNIGAVYNVMRALVLRDIDLFTQEKDLLKLLKAPDSPDIYLGSYPQKSPRKSTTNTPTLRVVNQ
jgi:DNA (cytosine-5)-methyltransferase 1